MGENCRAVRDQSGTGCSTSTLMLSLSKHEAARARTDIRRNGSPPAPGSGVLTLRQAQDEGNVGRACVRLSTARRAIDRG